MSADRPGYALLVSVLLVLALATLALGAVAVGTREAVLAATLLRTEQAAVLAEAKAMDALRTWSTRRHRGVATGATASTPGGATVERAGPDLFLLRATAALPGGPAPVGATAGLLVRTFDTGPIEAQMPATVTADLDAVLSAGRIDAGAGCGVPLGTGLMAPSASIGAGVALTGAPPYAAPPGVGLPPADPTTDAAIAALADVRVPASTITPAPRLASGRCDPAPDNWGSPDPAHPCHAHLPLVHATGPVTLAGGQARALLLVEGSLPLEDATVHGAVLVRGTLTLDAGSRIRGAVRASRVSLDDGVIEGDPCETADALAAPALDRPFALPERWWVPVF